jgi:hypothetical protein
MLPIKHKKEPLDKVLEAHLPADLIQNIKVNQGG